MSEEDYKKLYTTYSGWCSRNGINRMSFKDYKKHLKNGNQNN